MKLRPLWSAIQWIGFAKNWTLPILLEFNMTVKDQSKDDDVVIYARNGFTYQFPFDGRRSNHGLISEIFFYRPYHKRGFLPQQDWLIIDLGANMGVFSLWCKSKAIACKIYAYEPMERNFKYLKLNTQWHNSFGTIIPIKGAIGPKNGKIKMNKSYLSDNGHSLYSEWTKHPRKETEEVQCFNLKNVLEDLHQKEKKEIDLLKMDIEGAEYDILMNIPPESLRLVKRIMFEYHQVGHNCKGHIFNRLLELGYEYEGENQGVLFFTRRDVKQ